MKLRSHPGRIVLFIPFLLSLLVLTISRFSVFFSSLRAGSFIGQIGQSIRLPQPDRFSAAIMGDCRGNTEAMEKILLDAKSKADFALILGDLVFKGETADYQFLVQELNEVQGNFPVYPAIGNHDLAPGGGHQLYESVFGSRHYWLKAGAALLVVIDNVEGKEFDAEMKWMDQALKTEAGGAQLIFLMMHEPPYVLYQGKPHSLSLEETGRLMEVVHRYPVSAIFSSHIHDYMSYQYEGIPVYITGEAGAPQKKDIPNYGYLLLRVQDGRYRVERVALGNISDRDRLERILLVKCYGFWPALTIGLLLLPLLLILKRGCRKDRSSGNQDGIISF